MVGSGESVEIDRKVEDEGDGDRGSGDDDGEKPNSISSGCVVDALRKVWIWPRGIVIVVEGGARRAVMPSWLEVAIPASVVVDWIGGP